LRDSIIKDEVERPSHEWNGNLSSRDLNPEYLVMRNQSANAAKTADWDVLLGLLNKLPSLANSARPDGRSWFTPLHQAAFNNAPPEVILQLIDLGAFRTLKSFSGKRPVDIAKEKGFHDCAGLLEPEIRHPVDPLRLAIMQELLHGLVRAVSLCYPVDKDLRLPELSILTEFTDDALWFPIPGMYGGFNLWLEEREDEPVVITESWCRVVEGSGRRHRIGPFEVVLLEEGFV
jgi:hypothetical protein